MVVSNILPARQETIPYQQAKCHGLEPAFFTAPCAALTVSGFYISDKIYVVAVGSLCNSVVAMLLLFKAT
jgi:hypothetical protein